MLERPIQVNLLVNFNYSILVNGILSVLVRMEHEMFFCFVVRVDQIVQDSWHWFGMLCVSCVWVCVCICLSHFNSSSILRYLFEKLKTKSKRRLNRD